MLKKEIRLAFYGPSGSGKTYLKSYFINSKRYNEIKSVTTRPQRYENDDEYEFISEMAFANLGNDLININKYDGYCYGIKKRDFICSSNTSVLITDVSNLTTLHEIALKHQKRFIRAYCESPSKEELYERHKIRGTMDRYPLAIKEMVKERAMSINRAHYVISNIQDADEMHEEISKT